MLHLLFIILVEVFFDILSKFFEGFVLCSWEGFVSYQGWDLFRVKLVGEWVFGLSLYPCLKSWFWMQSASFSNLPLLSTTCIRWAEVADLVTGPCPLLIFLSIDCTLSLLFCQCFKVAIIVVRALLGIYYIMIMQAVPDHFFLLFSGHVKKWSRCALYEDRRAIAVKLCSCTSRKRFWFCTDATQV